MNRTVNLFIGYDPRQPIAFAVAAASACRNSEVPVTITQLRLKQLPITRRGLTEFTYTRFLVPYLSDYTGVSMFIDSDTLVRGDIGELLAYPVAYRDTPIFVVPHTGALKFERASVMVFNNELCKHLTPAYVENPQNGLFDLSWASTVGALPGVWNHLVGYDTPDPKAKLVHFTKGIPVWPQTIECEFSKDWQTECRILGSTVPFEELMGNSVHTYR